MLNTDKSKFIKYHLVIPFITLTLPFLYFMFLGGDSFVATKIYALQGGKWVLNDHWITNNLIHKGGKYLSTLAIAVSILLYIFLLISSNEKYVKWRKPLIYLILASLTSATLVSLLKVVTNMDCPWNLIQFGGNRPFVGLLEMRPREMGNGKCFPAGHASSGYAWVSLYFFFKMTISKYRWIGLCCGIFAGLIFGISQQLRGAHFVSHDIATLSVCWITALLFYLAFIKNTNPNKSL